MVEKAETCLKAAQAVIAIIVIGTIAYETIFLLSTASLSLVVLLGEIILPAVIRIVQALVPDMNPAVDMNYLVVGFHTLTAACWIGGCIALFTYLCGRTCIGQACEIAEAGLAFSIVNSMLFLVTALLGMRRLALATRLSKQLAEQRVKDKTESDRSSVSYGSDES